MKTPEILAPAGGFDSVKAAVRCSADAVYFGGKSFNARRNAANFDGGELKEAIDYCRERGVKVYITLNTLVKDREFEALCGEIKEVCRLGADAFIIQDPGVASAVREICPDIRLHASTQMTVNTPSGMNLLRNLGFSRTVLPREFSREEIINAAANTDIELEAFVHGALCMCLSGQCLMSSVIGGRSGNRGLCAQPCRLPFGINRQGGCNLSLKDLSLTDKIGELAEAGVCSLKIEGRMKRPEYVAAAVTACKNSRDGIYDDSVNSALGSVFSRSGFTSGYYDGKIGRDMFGVRTKDDVVSASKVLGELSHLYENERPLLPVDMKFTLKSGVPASLEAKCGKFTVSVSSDAAPAAAVNREADEEDISSRLSKCGGTQYYARKIGCVIEPGLYISASEINSLRRRALEALNEKIKNEVKYTVNDIKITVKPHIASDKKQLHLRFSDHKTIPAGIYADRIIIPLDTPDEAVRSLIGRFPQTAVEIPVCVFSNEEKFLKRLLELKNLGVSLVSAGNLDGVALAQKAGMRFASGFGMNLFNTRAVEEIEKLGAADCLASAELLADEISRLGGGLPRGVLIYGRLPLMVTRNCPVKNELSCEKCGRQSELVDRTGARFPVRCKYGFSFIYNSVPVCMTDRLADIKNTDFDLLYFTVENSEEIKKIIDGYHSGSVPDYGFTRGLYYRNVL